MNNEKNLNYWDRVMGGSAEFNRVGIISITLTIVACLGGLSVGLGAVSSFTQLTVTVLSTMTVLVLILGVQPVKWILNASVAAILIDMIFIAYNILL